ncbi:hypothetical protein [Streptomyces sp. NBC_01235]|uniref:hypothetical protein n=1 Tax=Streptomyces sp. NBC_01235 TaxID=2903788 RepID=UPI002E0D7C10|nr:hypothetical protein OG289_31095 [Streptomyces sp. NBC_01235]
MTNDRLQESREGADVIAAGRNTNRGGFKDRPAVAVAVMPLWERPRTGMRR